MNRNSLALVAILGTAGSSALGQTITVDICNDIIDVDPDAATFADLPGPDGHVSFSEAMIASNNTPGRQTIGFAIPTSEWTYLDWYFPGRAVVHTIVGFYWRAYDEVTIDGTTQTAFTGDTNPDGWEVVLWGTTLYLNADNCTVVGLDSSSASVTESNGLIDGNTAMGIELFGGSGSLVRNNTGGTLKIDRSNDNVVVGNTFQRVRVLGWVGGGQPATNNRVGGPTPAERNYITGFGTWNSEGYPGGFAVQVFDALGTVIENNSIGTTADGMQQGHLGTTSGIIFEGENHGTLIRNNRIAGILGHGMGPHYDGWLVGSALTVYGTGSDITIQGNTIGLNAAGEPVLGSVTGIASYDYYLGPVQGVTIGGQGPGEGNEIAGHLVSGIVVVNPFAGVTISGNSIHGNAGIGIDLVTPVFQYGVTLNDPGDADAGGNGLQNFPVLASASGTGSATTVQGSLNSLANQVFILEFFASPACELSGYGQGTTYLGAATVTTDGAGNAAFSVTLPVGAADGSSMTAIAAQNATGNTSEFSACVTLTVTNPVGDLDGDGAVGVTDFLALLASWGPCPGPCPPSCAADFDGDCAVGVTDMLTLLANWS